MERVRALYAKSKTFWVRYERHLTAGAFLLGFIVDSLTLRRVDLWLENLAFVSYLGIAALCIILFNAYDDGLLRGRAGHSYAHWFPVIMQFAFGALFSGFFVFYTRSATLAGSWLFLLFLLGLFVANEVLKKKYAKFIFQIAVFFILAFSYAIFLVPVIMRSLGAHTFIISGFAGLLAAWLVCIALQQVAPRRYMENRFRALVVIAALYGLFNLLYFTNIIPPIPLALKEVGVYHSVMREASGMYRVTYEPVRWYELGKRIRPTFHRAQGEPTYVFSAVFAPIRLSIEIFHRWSFYNEAVGKWVEHNRVGFTIAGGRDGGYRAYSLGRSLRPGRWRVDIITGRGQLIGRTTFWVEEAAVSPLLVTARR